ncbi:hypothetical protein HDU76_009584 [Blyttiomyces sp. JEL0837]|nr:hypothetical protein HDU76_009584 [Blyttiomyces sp. JEL0837]
MSGKAKGKAGAVSASPSAASPTAEVKGEGGAEQALGIPKLSVTIPDSLADIGDGRAVTAIINEFALWDDYGKVGLEGEGKAVLRELIHAMIRMASAGREETSQGEKVNPVLAQLYRIFSRVVLSSYLAFLSVYMNTVAKFEVEEHQALALAVQAMESQSAIKKAVDTVAETKKVNSYVEVEPTVRQIADGTMPRSFFFGPTEVPILERAVAYGHVTVGSVLFLAAGVLAKVFEVHGKVRSGNLTMAVVRDTLLEIAKAAEVVKSRRDYSKWSNTEIN